MKLSHNLSEAIPSSSIPKALLSVLAETEFTLEASRAAYFFPSFAIQHGFTYKRGQWVEKLLVAGIYQDHQVRWFYGQKTGQAGYEKFLTPYLHAKALVNLEGHILRTTAIAIQHLITFRKTRPTQASMKTALRHFHVGSAGLFVASIALRNLDRGVLAYFRRVLHDTKQENDERIALFSIPSKVPPTSAETLQLLEIAEKVAKAGTITPLLEQKIRDIAKKNCWIPMGYFSEQPKTFLQYREEVLRLAKERPGQVLRTIHSRRRKELAARHRLLQTHSLADRRVAQIASTAAWLKDVFKFNMNHLLYEAEPLLRAIAKDTSLHIDIVKDLFPAEQLGLVRGTLKNPAALVRRRRKGTALLATIGSLTVLEGREADRFVRQYLPVQKKSAIFHGRAASPGHVRGKVRVVLRHADMKKFRKGEILVAVNTTPDFVAIMKKASAIIAEEGGLTSHASVVSRELGVPCVVGVLDATRIFKNGERLNVDANKGTIKKLS